MKKNLLFITLLFLGLVSCKKDNTVTPSGGTNYKSNILGIVLDENNNPVENATVEYNGVTKSTDKNGIYQFKNVDVNSIHSFVTIKKGGYFDANRAFNTQKGASIKLTNILLKKTFSFGFPSANGGSISSQNFTITFPADAVVNATTGAAYSGTVKVAIKHLEPDNLKTYDEMPGNLTGLNTSNNRQLLTTFGMLAVELQSTSGEKLQIKSGKQVELKVKLSSSVLATAPATIPMWYFDEATGYWKEEGSATLINGEYVGNVSHFTYWNYDYNSETINISGKVVDQNGNPVECHIGFYEGTNGGGHGYTNTDGTYSGPVTKGVVLNVSISAIQGNCNNQVIYTAQVGPFNTDVVLPDITVTVSTANLFSFSGNFVDCNGNAVQSGYVKISEGGSDHFFDIINGSAAASYLTCVNPINATVVAIDAVNVKDSDPIALTGPGPHNLGTVSVCANVPDHITIVNANLGLNEIRYDFAVSDSGSSKLIYINYKQGTPIENFTIIYDDPSPSGFSVGTHALTGGYGYFVNPSSGFYFKNGSITVTQGGTTGDTLLATYTVTMQKNGTTDLETFTGEIKWKIQ